MASSAEPQLRSVSMPHVGDELRHCGHQKIEKLRLAERWSRERRHLLGERHPNLGRRALMHSRRNASGCTTSTPTGSHAAAGKWRTFEVTIASASEATAAASTCRSPGSLVIADSSDAIAASGTSASSNARSIAWIKLIACSSVARRSLTRLRATSSRILRLHRTA